MTLAVSEHVFHREPITPVTPEPLQFRKHNCLHYLQWAASAAAVNVSPCAIAGLREVTVEELE